MPFRNELFIAWVGLTLVLWGGAFWAINISVEDSFDQLDRQTWFLCGFSAVLSSRTNPVRTVAKPSRCGTTPFIAKL